MTAAATRRWWGSQPAREAFSSLLDIAKRNPSTLKHARLAELVCASCDRAPATVYRTEAGAVLVAPRAAGWWERAILDGEGVHDPEFTPQESVRHSALMAVYLLSELDELGDVEVQCRCQRRRVGEAQIRALCQKAATRPRHRVLMH